MMYPDSKDISEILKAAQGFCRTVKYSFGDIGYVRKYSISDGRLYISEKGTSPWSGRKYSDEWQADENETRLFVFDYLPLIESYSRCEPLPDDIANGKDG